MDSRSIKITTRNRGRSIVMVEAHTGGYDDARIVWQAQQQTLALKFNVEGSWHYQLLQWSCRGARHRYYRALVAIYRFLTRSDLVRKGSLRSIAIGARVFEIALDDTVLARGSEDSPVMSAYYRLRNMSADARRAEIEHHYGLDLTNGPRTLSARILRTPMSNQPWAGKWDMLQLH